MLAKLNDVVLNPNDLFLKLVELGEVRILDDLIHAVLELGQVLEA